MIWKHEIINELIRKNGYTSYLEIGLNNPNAHFTKIECLNKESCDPYIVGDSSLINDNVIDKVGDQMVDEEGNLTQIVKDNLTWRLTSDEMFAMIPNDKKWDIILVDGLHLKEQTTKDILNAMKHLNKNGVIIVHDCLPHSYEAQTRERVSSEWNGDVWKAVARMGLLGLKFKVLDTDYGVGVIPYQEMSNVLREKCFDNDYLTWDDFVKYRNELMHVIEEDQIQAFVNGFPWVF